MLFIAKPHRLQIPIGVLPRKGHPVKGGGRFLVRLKSHILIRQNTKTLIASKSRLFAVLVQKQMPARDEMQTVGGIPFARNEVLIRRRLLVSVMTDGQIDVRYGVVVEPRFLRSSLFKFLSIHVFSITRKNGQVN